MRVLHVTDVYLPNLGGIEVLVDDLTRHQAARGLTPTILTRQSGSAGSAGSDRATGARVSPVPVIRDPGLAGVLLAETDLVHVHLSVHSPLGWRMAVRSARAGLPTVVTVHSMWHGVWPVIREIDRLTGVSRLPIQWGAVSHAAARPVAAALRPESGVLVLPNAIDVAAWRRPVPALAPGRSASTAPIVLVSTLRMARRKRPIALTRLLAEVRRRVPPQVDLRGVLVGDGPLLDRTRRFADHAGLSSWVSLPGRLDHGQLRELYAAAHVFVAPASLESFGIAGLEARAAGLAIAGRTGTGLEEFVRSGVDGALVDSDAALADQLVRWCTERTELTAINAHNAALAPVFDWDTVLDRCLIAYDAATLQARAAEPRVLTSRVA